MPEKMLGSNAMSALKRIGDSAIIKRTWWGWPVPALVLHSLIRGGFVRVFYDMEDQGTKCELTDMGKARLDREVNSNRVAA